MNDEILDVPSIDWLVPFLLLSLREGDSHGHELARRMPEFGLGATRPGAVYRALRQMEREGVVASEGDELDGHLPRRRFSITGSGEAYLELWANALARYEEEIYLFFGTYVESSSRRAPAKGGQSRVSLEAKRLTTGVGHPHLRRRTLRCVTYG